MKALKDKGFKVPEAIDGDKVRKTGDHFYDQIAVRVKDPRFRVRGGGMIDLFEDVFRDGKEDMELYAAHIPTEDPEKKSKFKATTPTAGTRNGAPDRCRTMHRSGSRSRPTSPTAISKTSPRVRAANQAPTEQEPAVTHHLSAAELKTLAAMHILARACVRARIGVKLRLCRTLGPHTSIQAITGVRASE